ncbi:MAG: hypothetical protein DMG21_18745 [Acidobacteria bacterium]|nr:MAG: hypothetical protein DMG21_18745 [Acidobacteriota bacterium]
MKFPEPLGHFGIPGGMRLQQVFRLVLEMIEIGIRWKASYRHDELPFVGPRSAYLRAESQFVKTNCSGKVDFCPFRGPDAPFALPKA